jgi:hypothetical protein
MDARADLEKFFGKQIHIELYVKKKKLRSNVNMLKVLLQPIANGLNYQFDLKSMVITKLVLEYKKINVGIHILILIFFFQYACFFKRL